MPYINHPSESWSNSLTQLHVESSS